MTKISNQYSLTNILTADLANSRLGINNVSPTVALDVTGSGKFSGAVTFGNDLNFSATDSAISFASGAARFFTGGGERMRIDSTGRVLIAGTSSSGSPIFQIQKSDSTTNSSSYFWNTYSSGMMIKNSDATVNTLAPIYFYMGSGNNSIAGIAGIQESSTLGAIGFFTGGSGRSSTVPERMRITSGGDVAIGTTTADPYGFGYTSLSIRGGTYAGAGGHIHLITPTTDTNGQVLGQINFIDGARANGIISVRRATSTTTANMLFYTDGGSGLLERMRITSAGNVAINNTTGTIYSKLSVAGGIAFGNNTDSNLGNKSYGNAFSKQSTVVAGGATVTIKPTIGAESSLILVSGIVEATGNRFADLILIIGAGGTPLVVGSRTFQTPATRTYTNGGENLRLQLTGSSETYIVWITGFGGNESS